MRKPSRMEQLGNLFTAMIAVIVGGSCDLLLAPDAPPAPGWRPDAGRTGYICVPEEIISQFPGSGRCKGLVTKVARETKRPTQVVTGVLHGRFASVPIATALIKGIAERLGSEAAHSITPGAAPEKFGGLRAEELVKFRNSGRYSGLLTKVASDLDVTLQFASAVANGKSKSARILAALREEMKRADASPPARKTRRPKAPPFTPEEISALRAGKYRGLRTRVAAALGVRGTTVTNVLCGNTTSAHIAAAIKAEKQRMDAGRAQ